ncbi:radical SAM/SPASM domain-containing protein [Brachyspira pulli]|uniref:radical SAM/SPASM domain-containing protein n=1 Tax=Brachyspira pulli TaxID=310721 RepID=UPI003006F864
MSIKEEKDIIYYYAKPSESIEEYNKKVVEIYKNRDYMSWIVYIETVNRCNSTCNFCPVSVGNEKRPYMKMSEELFNKIINDLVDIDYSRSIGLFLTNEPFLDDRIIEFAKIAKTKLPKARLEILTNGSVFTLEKFKESYKYFDYIHINNYSDDDKLHKNVQEIYDFCKQNPQYIDKTYIAKRKLNEFLSTRGGNVPNRKESLQTLPYLCYLPIVQFPIRPDGKVSLCCCDTYGQMTLGDVNTTSIKDIWNSETYKKINELMLKGRENLEICKYCDYLDMLPYSQGHKIADTFNLYTNLLKQ